jgi:hypothetical protein
MKKQQVSELRLSVVEARKPAVAFVDESKLGGTDAFTLISQHPGSPTVTSPNESKITFRFHGKGEIFLQHDPSDETIEKVNALDIEIRESVDPNGVPSRSGVVSLIKAGSESADPTVLFVYEIDGVESVSIGK